MVILYLLYQTLTLSHFTDSNGFVRVGVGVEVDPASFLKKNTRVGCPPLNL